MENNSKPGIARHASLRHLLAIAAGLAIGMLVFFYTGDSDFIFALGSGLGAVCLVYLGGNFLCHRRAVSPPKTRAF